MLFTQIYLNQSILDETVQLAKVGWFFFESTCTLRTASISQVTTTIRAVSATKEIITVAFFLFLRARALCACY